MSMTREKAIALLNEQYETCKRIYDCSADQRKSYPNVPQFMEALDMALIALRPITREQVEKTKAVFCQPCVGDFEQDTWRCSKCFVQEFGDVRGINFCPHCGAPMTDEAVETIMKRMEEMWND